MGAHGREIYNATQSLCRQGFKYQTDNEGVRNRWKHTGECNHTMRAKLNTQHRDQEIIKVKHRLDTQNTHMRPGTRQWAGQAQKCWEDVG